MSFSGEHRIVAVPQSEYKVVHLIRHGQGFHNLADVDPDRWEEITFDAHLTDKGWAQVFAGRRHIVAHQVPVEVVVASPLTRTLETAAGFFGTDAPVGPPAGGDGLLMAAVSAAKGRRVAQGAIGMPAVRVVANELCRETIWREPCCARRSISRIKEQFPGVDFSQIATDADTLFDTDKNEATSAVRERARRFAHWLSARPERNIAVVSHSDFLDEFTALFGRCCSSAVRNHLRYDWCNAEMRSIVLLRPCPARNPWNPGMA